MIKLDVQLCGYALSSCSCSIRAPDPLLGAPTESEKERRDKGEERQRQIAARDFAARHRYRDKMLKRYFRRINRPFHFCHSFPLAIHLRYQLDPRNMGQRNEIFSRSRDFRGSPFLLRRRASLIARVAPCKPRDEEIDVPLCPLDNGSTRGCIDYEINARETIR